MGLLKVLWPYSSYVCRITLWGLHMGIMDSHSTVLVLTYVIKVIIIYFSK